MRLFDLKRRYAGKVSINQSRMGIGYIVKDLRFPATAIDKVRCCKDLECAYRQAETFLNEKSSTANHSESNTGTN